MNQDIQFDQSFQNIIPLAKKYADKDYSIALEVVLTTAFNDLRNLPNLGYPKKIEKVIQPIPLEDYIKKWVAKYLGGYNSRPSVRTGKKSGTFSDPIIKSTLSFRLPHLTVDDLLKIEEGHSSLMSIENLIGDLLEEYLSIELAPLGWYCCWGSSIDAVDFCCKEGDLLQVKNSDNSENSSSSRVRNGTEIKKWHRRKSKKKETFCWDVLQEMVRVQTVSEEHFRAFIKRTMESNPKCLHVDLNNKYVK